MNALSFTWTLLPSFDTGLFPLSTDQYENAPVSKPQLSG